MDKGKEVVQTQKKQNRKAGGKKKKKKTKVQSLKKYKDTPKGSDNVLNLKPLCEYLYVKAV